MDAALLTTPEFWNNPAPFAGMGSCPDIPDLEWHVLFETSGSSGKPKSVAISKQALLVSAGAVNQHLRVDDKSRWGLALPAHHVGGFGVAARAYQADCAMEQFRGKWDARAFRAWLSTAGITHTSLVPTQVHDLVSAGVRAPASLVAIVVGGGRLDEAMGRKARSLGWPLLASYGMSEAGSQIATQGLEILDQPYIASPIPILPVWRTRITEEGLLAISGDALFSGYVIDGKFFPRASEWHVTSDRAILRDKSITPCGRADTLVKVLGELVDPEEIERELADLSEGSMAMGTFAIAAVPDERAEHALVLLVEDVALIPKAEVILSFYNSACPGYRRIREVCAIVPFPRSELGKIRRKELAIIYQNQRV